MRLQHMTFWQRFPWLGLSSFLLQGLALGLVFIPMGFVVHAAVLGVLLVIALALTAGEYIRKHELTEGADKVVFASTWGCSIFILALGLITSLIFNLTPILAVTAFAMTLMGALTLVLEIKITVEQKPLSPHFSSGLSPTHESSNPSKKKLTPGAAPLPKPTRLYSEGKNERGTAAEKASLLERRNTAIQPS